MDMSQGQVESLLQRRGQRHVLATGVQYCRLLQSQKVCRFAPEANLTAVFKLHYYRTTVILRTTLYTTLHYSTLQLIYTMVRAECMLYTVGSSSFFFLFLPVLSVGTYYNYHAVVNCCKVNSIRSLG